VKQSCGDESKECCWKEFTGYSPDANKTGVRKVALLGEFNFLVGLIELDLA
jgi:hypothetical protein